MSLRYWSNEESSSSPLLPDIPQPTVRRRLSRLPVTSNNASPFTELLEETTDLSPTQRHLWKRIVYPICFVIFILFVILFVNALIVGLSVLLIDTESINYRIDAFDLPDLCALNRITNETSPIPFSFQAEIFNPTAVHLELKSATVQVRLDGNSESFVAVNVPSMTVAPLQLVKVDMKSAFLFNDNVMSQQVIPFLIHNLTSLIFHITFDVDVSTPSLLIPISTRQTFTVLYDLSNSKTKLNQEKEQLKVTPRSIEFLPTLDEYFGYDIRGAVSLSGGDLPRFMTLNLPDLDVKIEMDDGMGHNVTQIMQIAIENHLVSFKESINPFIATIQLRKDYFGLRQAVQSFKENKLNSTFIISTALTPRNQHCAVARWLSLVPYKIPFAYDRSNNKTTTVSSVPLLNPNQEPPKVYLALGLVRAHRGEPDNLNRQIISFQLDLDKELISYMLNTTIAVEVNGTLPSAFAEVTHESRKRNVISQMATLKLGPRELLKANDPILSLQMDIRVENLTDSFSTLQELARSKPEDDDAVVIRSNDKTYFGHVMSVFEYRWTSERGAKEAFDLFNASAPSASDAARRDPTPVTHTFDLKASSATTSQANATAVLSFQKRPLFSAQRMRLYWPSVDVAAFTSDERVASFALDSGEMHLSFAAVNPLYLIHQGNFRLHFMIQSASAVEMGRSRSVAASSRNILWFFEKLLDGQPMDSVQLKVSVAGQSWSTEGKWPGFKNNSTSKGTALGASSRFASSFLFDGMQMLGFNHTDIYTAWRISDTVLKVFEPELASNSSMSILTIDRPIVMLSNITLPEIRVLINRNDSRSKFPDKNFLTIGVPSMDIYLKAFMSGASFPSNLKPELVITSDRVPAAHPHSVPVIVTVDDTKQLFDLLDDQMYFVSGIVKQNMMKSSNKDAVVEAVIALYVMQWPDAFDGVNLVSRLISLSVKHDPIYTYGRLTSGPPVRASKPLPRLNAETSAIQVEDDLNVDILVHSDNMKEFTANCSVQLPKLAYIRPAGFIAEKEPEHSSAKVSNLPSFFIVEMGDLDIQLMYEGVPVARIFVQQFRHGTAIGSNQKFAQHLDSERVTLSETLHGSFSILATSANNSFVETRVTNKLKEFMIEMFDVIEKYEHFFNKTSDVLDKTKKPTFLHVQGTLREFVKPGQNIMNSPVRTVESAPFETRYAKRIILARRVGATDQSSLTSNHDIIPQHIYIGRGMREPMYLPCLLTNLCNPYAMEPKSSARFGVDLNVHMGGVERLIARASAKLAFALLGIFSLQRYPKNVSTTLSISPLRLDGTLNGVQILTVDMDPLHLRTSVPLPKPRAEFNEAALTVHDEKKVLEINAQIQLTQDVRTASLLLRQSSFNAAFSNFTSALPNLPGGKSSTYHLPLTAALTTEYRPDGNLLSALISEFLPAVPLHSQSSTSNTKESPKVSINSTSVEELVIVTTLSLNNSLNGTTIHIDEILGEISYESSNIVQVSLPQLNIVPGVNNVNVNVRVIAGPLGSPNRAKLAAVAEAAILNNEIPMAVSLSIGKKWRALAHIMIPAKTINKPKSKAMSTFQVDPLRSMKKSILNHHWTVQIRQSIRNTMPFAFQIDQLLVDASFVEDETVQFNAFENFILGSNRMASDDENRILIGHIRVTSPVCKDEYDDEKLKICRMRPLSLRNPALYVPEKESRDLVVNLDVPMQSSMIRIIKQLSSVNGVCASVKGVASGSLRAKDSKSYFSLDVPVSMPSLPVSGADPCNTIFECQAPPVDKNDTAVWTTSSRNQIQTSKGVSFVMLNAEKNSESIWQNSPVLILGTVVTSFQFRVKKPDSSNSRLNFAVSFQTHSNKPIKTGLSGMEPAVSLVFDVVSNEIKAIVYNQGEEEVLSSTRVPNVLFDGLRWIDTTVRYDSTLGVFLVEMKQQLSAAEVELHVNKASITKIRRFSLSAGLLSQHLRGVSHAFIGITASFGGVSKMFKHYSSLVINNWSVAEVMPSLLSSRIIFEKEKAFGLSGSFIFQALDSCSRTVPFENALTFYLEQFVPQYKRHARADEKNLNVDQLKKYRVPFELVDPDNALYRIYYNVTSAGIYNIVASVDGSCEKNGELVTANLMCQPVGQIYVHNE